MNTDAVIHWLAVEGRKKQDHEQMLTGFVAQCRDAGLPLVRLRFVLLMLHPQDVTYLATWRKDRPFKKQTVHKDIYPQMLRASPLAPMIQGVDEVRYCLSKEDSFEEEILNVLKRDGHTDYFAQVLSDADGNRVRAVVYGTDDKDGFSDEHIDFLRAIHPFVGLIAEIHAQARRTKTLLDTYVGKLSGQRVLDGKIARGSVENINAVVWFCDLQGFTRLTEELSGDDLLQMLNDFFGVLTPIIESCGGEVLKFIGDAVLAIFPVEQGPESKKTASDEREACEQAMTAVQLVKKQMIQVNRRRADAAQPLIEFGLALHLGEVHYGNIGGPTRLDFTVIGPTVNLASRIEAQTRVLGKEVLVSEAFFEAAPEGLTRCAEVSLKGVLKSQALYTLE